MRPLAPGLAPAPAVSAVAVVDSKVAGAVVVDVVVWKGESSVWCRWKRSGLVLDAPGPLGERATLVALERGTGAVRPSPGLRNLSSRQKTRKKKKQSYFSAAPGEILKSVRVSTLAYNSCTAFRLATGLPFLSNELEMCKVLLCLVATAG